MPTRRKNRKRKRTRKGGHRTKCEMEQNIEMMRAIRKALEDNRSKRCQKPSFKSAANKVKMANLAIKPEQPNVGDFFANAEKDASSAKSNWKSAANKVKMENLVQKQLKEHPDNESSKGDDNWHGWVARLDERVKSPNKGTTYYYKDGRATTWEPPKKGWVKIHEPQGGFYFWCPLKDLTTRERPQKNSCLVKRENNQSRGAKARKAKARRKRKHKTQKKFTIQPKLVGGRKRRRKTKKRKSLFKKSLFKKKRTKRKKRGYGGKSPKRTKRKKN